MAGASNDPDHNAQNPGTLLGKMLRIDVSVGDGDPQGYNVPVDNPFRGQPGYLPEIWSIGWRNPWRWSFDDPSLGGTGALVVGDVGQGAREEIDYEPAGRGGRNYGWRNREGTLDTNIQPNLPPAFPPLTDPIFDYGRSAGQSVTGGFVYRGTALGANYRGRYFFADFVAGRVWSLALSIAPGRARRRRQTSSSTRPNSAARRRLATSRRLASMRRASCTSAASTAAFTASFRALARRTRS